jgi:four helix bundle protein
MIMRKEIENRLVELAKNIEKLSKKLKPGFYAEHISNQLMRSSTSAALNYGEAQAAESKKDFIHKNSIVLKELRESQISLKLLSDSINKNAVPDMNSAINECDQLIAIFHKTLTTARKNK